MMVVNVYSRLSEPLFIVALNRYRLRLHQILVFPPPLLSAGCHLTPWLVTLAIDGHVLGKITDRGLSPALYASHQGGNLCTTAISHQTFHFGLMDIYI